MKKLFKKIFDFFNKKTQKNENVVSETKLDLFLAVMDRNIQEVYKLLEEGVNPNIVFYKKKTYPQGEGEISYKVAYTLLDEAPTPSMKKLLQAYGAKTYRQIENEERKRKAQKEEKMKALQKAAEQKAAEKEEEDMALVEKLIKGKIA